MENNPYNITVKRPTKEVTVVVRLPGMEPDRGGQITIVAKIDGQAQIYFGGTNIFLPDLLRFREMLDIAVTRVFEELNNG